MLPSPHLSSLARPLALEPCPPHPPSPSPPGSPKIFPCPRLCLTPPGLWRASRSQRATTRAPPSSGPSPTHPPNVRSCPGATAGSTSVGPSAGSGATAGRVTPDRCQRESTPSSSTPTCPCRGTCPPRMAPPMSATPPVSWRAAKPDIGSRDRTFAGYSLSPAKSCHQATRGGGGRRRSRGQW